MAVSLCAFPVLFCQERINLFLQLCSCLCHTRVIHFIYKIIVGGLPSASHDAVHQRFAVFGRHSRRLFQLGLDGVRLKGTSNQIRLDVVFGLI